MLHAVCLKLGTPRLTLALVGVFIALLVLAIAIPQVTDPNPSFIHYAAAKLGLNRIFQSAWFSFLLIGFFLNLGANAFLQIKSLFTKPSPNLQTTLAVESDFDDFRESLLTLSPRDFGYPTLVAGNESRQFFSERSKLSGIAQPLFCIGGMLLALAFLISHGFGHEFQVTLEEGKRIDVSPLLGNGVEMENRRFDVTYSDFTRQVDSIQSRISIFEENTFKGSASLGLGRPASWGAVKIYYSGFEPMKNLLADLLVRDKNSDHFERFSRVEAGKTYAVDESHRFQIEELVEDFSQAGKAAKIRWGSDPGFWVFARYPDFDFGHSGHPFQISLSDASFGSRVTYRLVQNPGAPIAALGGVFWCISILMFLLTRGASQRRYWFQWYEDKITLQSQTNNPFRSVSEFRELVQVFQKPFLLFNPDLEDSPIEVKHVE